MSNLPGMTKDAKVMVLNTTFKGDQNYWLGLALVGEGEVTLELLGENEPVGFDGYDRRRLDQEDWTISDDLNVEAESIQVLFRNGASPRWPSVNVAFLATTRGNDGILVAWSYLKATRDLFHNDELLASMAISY